MGIKNIRFENNNDDELYQEDDNSNCGFEEGNGMPIIHVRRDSSSDPSKSSQNQNIYEEDNSEENKASSSNPLNPILKLSAHNASDRREVTHVFSPDTDVIVPQSK